MALIKCPECEREISDKAIQCIHCGYPLTPIINTFQTQENRILAGHKKYRVRLTGFDDKSKVQTIRVVRELTNLSMVDAKALIESFPCYIVDLVPQEEIQNIEEKFTSIGANVEIEEMKIDEESLFERPFPKTTSYGAPAEVKPQEKGIGFFGVVGAILLAVFIMMFL